MARRAKSSGSQDLIHRISDTIADHPRVSAAAAFQMGVLLGQAMQHSSALRGIGRRMAAAPGVIASSLPTFGLFEAGSTEKARAHPARASARRSPAKRSKRARRA